MIFCGKRCRLSGQFPSIRGGLMVLLMILLCVCPVLEADASELTEEEKGVIEAFAKEFDPAYGKKVEEASGSGTVSGEAAASTEVGAEQQFHAADDGKILALVVQQLAKSNVFGENVWSRLIVEDKCEATLQELESRLSEKNWNYNSTAGIFYDSTHTVKWTAEDKNPYEAVVAEWKLLYADPYLEKLSEIQMGMEDGFDGIPVTDLAEIEEKVGEISVAQDNGWRIIRSGIQPEIRCVCVLLGLIFGLLIVLIAIIFYLDWKKNKQIEEIISRVDMYLQEMDRRDNTVLQKMDSIADVVSEKKNDEQIKAFIKKNRDKKGLEEAEGRNEERASAVGVPVKPENQGYISGDNKETQQDKVEYLTAWCKGEKFSTQNRYRPEHFSFTKAGADDYWYGWSRILDGDNLRWKLVNNEYLEVEFVNKKIKKGNVFSTIIPVIYKLVQDGYVINDDKRDAEDTVSIADQNRIRLKDTGNGKFIIADSESRGRLEIKKENTPTY